MNSLRSTKSRLAALAVAAATLCSTVAASPPPAAASVSGRGSSSSGSSSSRTSITLDRPDGTGAGDVMVASIAANDAEGFSAPPGWTLVRDDAIGDVIRQAVYLKVATASEPSSYTWTLPHWRRVAGGITTYSGVDTTHPLDAHAAATHPDPGTAATAPSLTTTVPGARLIHLATVNAPGDLHPTDTLTERYEADSPNPRNDNDVTTAASDTTQPDPGATGTRTTTATNPGPRIAALLALRPAGSPPPDTDPPDTDPPDTDPPDTDPPDTDPPDTDPPDTEAPETTVDSGPPATTTATVATFTFSADEPATFACALDGAPAVPCTSPRAYAGLAAGPHTFTVTATDSAGNPDPNPATWTWTVEAEDPPPIDEAFIETVAGTGTAGFSGDGGPAFAARLDHPRTMAVDAEGNIFLVDSDNHRVRRIDAVTGVITTIAGTGSAGYSGDGGPAIDARLDTPHGIAVDPAGNVYVADSPNQRIRRISPDGIITTVAGTGASGYNDDGIPATEARLNYPKGVADGPDGSLYIGDANNHRVRRVDPSGIITTVAGTGTAGYSGDGGPATGARLHKPRNIAVDAAGNLYIADDENYVVRRVDPSGTIATVAGSNRAGDSGDGSPATEARLGRVRDVAVDAAGRLYIADEQNDRIRMVDPSGTITTLAGTGSGGFSGDGGPPADARVKGPRGVAVDPTGRLLIGDTGNNRIRRVTLA